MTLSQFYSIVDGDLNDVLNRLMKEESVKKFLRMFCEEPEYNILLEAYDNKDYKEVFRAAHTFKGLCASLGLISLQRSSSFICDAVRDGEPLNDIEPLIDLFKFDYAKIIDAIGKIED